MPSSSKIFVVLFIVKKHVAKYLFVFLVLTFSLLSYSHAQSNISDNCQEKRIFTFESLPNFYLCKARKFETQSNLDSAFYYYNKTIKRWVLLSKLKESLNLSERLGKVRKTISKELSAHLAFQKGLILNRYGTREDQLLAEEALIAAYNLYKMNNDTIGLIDVNLSRGYKYWEIFDTKTAESYFNEAAYLLNLYSRKSQVKQNEVAYWANINYLHKLFLNPELRKKEHRIVLNNFLYLLQQHKTIPFAESPYFISLIENDIGFYYWTLSKLLTIVTPKLHHKETLQDWQVRMLDSSVYHYRSAILSWENNFQSPHREIANTWNNMGLSYHDKYWHALEKEDENEISVNYLYAKEAYENALNIRNEIQNKSHPEFARNHSNLASLYETQEEFEKALVEYQKAIDIALGFKSNSKNTNLLALQEPNSYAQLLYAVKRKAHLLKIWFEVNKDINLLYESLNLYLFALEITENMLFRYQEGASVLTIMQKNWWIYENGIEVALQLYNQTQEDKYKKIALQISERSKANLTKARLQKRNAIELGIKDETLALKDNIFYHDIIQFTKKLSLARKSNVNDESIKQLESELLATKQKHNLFLQKLEASYPQYIKLKYRKSNNSLTEIRKKYLSSDSTTILEYFVGKNKIFVFRIDKDSLLVHSVPKDTLIDHHADILIKTLSSNNFKFDWQKHFNQFITASHYLFKRLVEPIYGSRLDKFENLIIVPDGYLNYIPFEVLIDTLPDKDLTNYGSLDYLLFKKNIRYAYSLDELTPIVKNLSTKEEINFLGFACTYQNRPSKSQLIGAAKAVEYGKKKLGGKTFIDMEVDKQMIINPIYKPKILQISMHANLSDAFPEDSNLELCTDSSELNIFDFYQADYSNIDLFILASCQTGNGVYQKGEGISSLAKSVLYAGCKSVIMSLWRLNDQSSEKIMSNYYDNVALGMGKTKALTKAKRNYIYTLKSQDTQTQFLHPYYWSGVILSGDNELIHFDNSSSNWYIYIGSIYLIISFTFYFLSKNRNKSSQSF